MTRTEKFVLAGVAIVASMLAGAFLGNVLRDWIGTAGSLWVWMVLVAVAYAGIRGVRDGRG